MLHGWTFLFFMTIDPLMLRVLRLDCKLSEEVREKARGRETGATEEVALQWDVHVC